MIIELQKSPQAVLPSEKLMDWVLTVVGRSYTNKEAADWSNWFLTEMVRLEDGVFGLKSGRKSFRSRLKREDKDRIFRIKSGVYLLQGRD